MSIIEQSDIGTFSPLHEKIEVTRVLLEKAVNGNRHEHSEAMRDLRELLRAPVVVRQEPVALTFNYRHPRSGERHSVTLTKSDVADGMEDTLYEKLSKQVCSCEPVGETNVVDCNCSDYTDDFELDLKALEPAAVLPKLGEQVAEAAEPHDFPAAQQQGEHTAVSFLERMLNGSGDDRLEAWQGEMAMLLEHLAEIKTQGEPVVHLVFGDTFYGTNGPEVGDYDIQYNHEACEKLAQAFPGQQVALYTDHHAPVALAERLIKAIEAEQERLSQEDYLMDSEECVKVIREEVARLNTQVLPLQRQPLR